MSKHTVLLIDDDKELLYIEKRYLEENGYHVFSAADALKALELLKTVTVDCIVLDVMMPGISGFEAFSKIKEISTAPVLFLSGKSEKMDRIEGLSLGADDYIVKPCSMEELILRIAINIRKNTSGKTKENVIEYPPLKIELLNQAVYYADSRLNFTVKEYELLVYFAKNPNRLITFEEIGKELNGVYFEADRKSIMVSVSRLRKKMSEYKGLAEMIETEWGKGYRFNS